jgi:predicted transcriptional regulator
VTVTEVVRALSLKVLSGEKDLERTVTGGYASDLLSLVMAGAKAGNIWVTMQGHPNVAAVASLLGLSAVIVTESLPVDQLTIQRAQENNLILLSTPHDTFSTISQLSGLGVTGTR